MNALTHSATFSAARSPAPSSDSDDLWLQTIELSDSVVVRAIGCIDASTAHRFRDGLGRALDATTLRLVVDLDRCGFMDSVGLGVLLGAYRRIAASGGALVVATEQPELLRLLHITGLDQVFTMQAQQPTASTTSGIPRQPEQRDSTPAEGHSAAVSSSAS